MKRILVLITSLLSWNAMADGGALICSVRQGPLQYEVTATYPTLNNVPSVTLRALDLRSGSQTPETIAQFPGLLESRQVTRNPSEHPVQIFREPQVPSKIELVIDEVTGVGTLRATVNGRPLSLQKMKCN